MHRLMKIHKRLKRLNSVGVAGADKHNNGSIYKSRKKLHTNMLPEQFTEAMASSDKFESFFAVIAPVLIMAQCFSLMPVSGIRESNPDQLKFQWLSFRTFFSLFYIGFAWALAVIVLRLQIIAGLTMRNIVGVVFYSSAMANGLIFLQLARNWSKIAKMWHNTEALFLRQPYRIRGRKLSTRIRRMVVIIICLAIGEYLLYLSSNFYNIEQKRIQCGVVSENLWEFFTFSRFRFIFDLVPYNFFLSLVIELFHISFTFAWNFIDLFLIIQNVVLALRFQQLNDQLLRFRGKAMHEYFWRESRLHFVALCELLEYLNWKMGPMILFSCLNNLYFICFSLLNVFNKLPNTISYVYFWCSLLYLIGRTAGVLLSAASINDAARRPIVVLKDVPTWAMCVELERFVNQVRTELIALSGMKFFHMTRCLILNVASTVFTFELAMLQLARDATNPPDRGFCD